MANKLFHGDPGDGLPSPWDVIQVNSFSPPVAQPHPMIPNLGRGHVFTVGGVPIPTGGGASTTSVGGGASGAESLGRVTAANGLVTAIANANFSTITAATYTVASTDDALWFDATSASITATMPLAAGSTTQRFVFVGKKDSSANTVTIGVSGSDTILGASSLVFSGQYDAALLVSDGVSAWVPYARFWGSQSANKVFAAPNGSAGLPTFRSIVNADLPIVDVTHGGSGANLSGTGGTGQYVKQVSTGATFTVGTIATADIPDTTNYRYPTFVFGNGGSALSTGLVNASIALNGPGTLVAVYLMSPDSTSGSATVDILRANAAIPTSSNSIVGGSGTKPALSSATYAKDTTFTSWTSTTFVADDVLSLNLTAVTSLKYLSVTLVIKVT